RARAPALGALAAELAFDGEQRFQQLARGELRLEGCGAVQERRLVDDPDRIGLAQRRDGDDPGQRVECRADRRLAVAEVGADTDVRAGHRSAVTVARPPSSSSSGLPTRTLALDAGN